MYDVDIHTLRIFLEAAKTGSFTRAGENLRVAQPNVSTSIAALEKEWQTPLFIRSKSGVKLTTRGEDFLSIAERIMDLTSEAERMMSGDYRPSGTLVIGSMESVAITRLPPFLYEFGKKWPAVRLVLKTADSGPLIELLRKGEIDCAFVGTPQQEEHWQEKILFREEMVLCIPKLSPIHNFNDLAGSKFLVLPDGCSYRNRLMNLIKNQEIIGANFHELGTLNSILACTVAGMGSAIFTKSFIERYAEAAKNLRILPLPKKERYMEIRLVWKKRKYLSPGLREFIEIFKG